MHAIPKATGRKTESCQSTIEHDYEKAVYVPHVSTLTYRLQAVIILFLKITERTNPAPTITATVTIEKVALSQEVSSAFEIKENSKINNVYTEHNRARKKAGMR